MRHDSKIRQLPRRCAKCEAVFQPEDGLDVLCNDCAWPGRFLRGLVWGLMIIGFVIANVIFWHHLFSQ